MHEQQENIGAPPDADPRPTTTAETTWGPPLFYAALVASLVYFWWLVIYDHGVAAGHGG